MASPKPTPPGGSKRSHKGGKIGSFMVTSHVNDLKDFDFYSQFLGGSLFRDVTGRVLRHAALKVKKNTLDALKQSFPNAFKGGGFRYVGGGSGYKKRDGSTRKFFSDKMSEGVRVGRLKGYFDKQSITVHIMGTRASESGTYRLRFYELGGPREKRGRIPGYHFFKAGTHHTDVWGIVKERLDDYLKKNGFM